MTTSPWKGSRTGFLSPGTVLSDASAGAAAKLAALYTKNVVNSVVVRSPHVRQVKLQVQIIEIDRSKVAQFGINLFSQGKNQRQLHHGTVSLGPNLYAPQWQFSGNSH